MFNNIQFETLFEAAIVKEMHQFGEVKHYKEGDLIMDYGKYIRMVPLILKGTIKVLKLDDDGNEILLYYLSNNESCSIDPLRKVIPYIITAEKDGVTI